MPLANVERSSSRAPRERAHQGDLAGGSCCRLRTGRQLPIDISVHTHSGHLLFRRRAGRDARGQAGRARDGGLADRDAWQSRPRRRDLRSDGAGRRGSRRAAQHRRPERRGAPRSSRCRPNRRRRTRSDADTARDRRDALPSRLHERLAVQARYDQVATAHRGGSGRAAQAGRDRLAIERAARRAAGEDRRIARPARRQAGASRIARHRRGDARRRAERRRRHRPAHHRRHADRAHRRPARSQSRPPGCRGRCARRHARPAGDDRRRQFDGARPRCPYRSQRAKRLRRGRRRLRHRRTGRRAARSARRRNDRTRTPAKRHLDRAPGRRARRRDPRALPSRGHVGPRRAHDRALGTGSLERVAVLSGLAPGDSVIVSDTTAFNDAPSVTLR